MASKKDSLDDIFRLPDEEVRPTYRWGEPQGEGEQGTGFWGSVEDGIRNLNAADLGSAFYNGAVVDNARGIIGTGKILNNTVQDLMFGPGANYALEQVYGTSPRKIVDEKIGEAAKLDAFKESEVPNTFANNLARGAGNYAGTAAILAAAAATRNPRIGTALASGLTGIQTGGGDYLENEANGASPVMNTAMSLTDAGLATGIDRLNFLRTLNADGVLKGAAKGFINEGAAEGLQEIPQEVTQSIAQGKDIDWANMPGNVVESALIGGILGSAGGATMGYMNNRRNRPTPVDATVETPEATVEAPAQTPTQQAPAQQAAPNKAVVTGARRFLNNQLEVMPLNTDEAQAAHAAMQDVLDNGTPEAVVNFARNAGFRPNYDNAAMQAMDYLVNEKGLSPEVAAGLVGNIMAESGGNTFDIDPEAVNPDSGAFGYVQWLDSRRQALEEFAHLTDRDIRDPYLQLDFMVNELNGTHSKAFQQILQGKSPEEIAGLTDDLYEVSEGTTRDARMANARSIYDAWMQGGNTNTARGASTSEGGSEATSELEKPVEAKGVQVELPEESKAETTTAKQDEAAATPEETAGQQIETAPAEQTTTTVSGPRVQQAGNVATPKIQPVRARGRAARGWNGRTAPVQTPQRAVVAPNRPVQNRPAQPVQQTPVQQNQPVNQAQTVQQNPQAVQTAPQAQTAPVQNRTNARRGAETNESTAQYKPQENQTSPAPVVTQEPMQNNVAPHVQIQRPAQTATPSKAVLARAKKAANSPAVVNAVKRADAGDVKAQQSLDKNFSPELQAAVREEIQNKESGNGKENPVSEESKNTGVQVEEPSRTSGERQAAPERKKEEVKAPAKEEKPAEKKEATKEPSEKENREAIGKKRESLKEDVTALGETAMEEANRLDYKDPGNDLTNEEKLSRLEAIRRGLVEKADKLYKDAKATSPNWENADEADAATDGAVSYIDEKIKNLRAIEKGKATRKKNKEAKNAEKTKREEYDKERSAISIDLDKKVVSVNEKLLFGEYKSRTAADNDIVQSITEAENELIALQEKTFGIKTTAAEEERNLLEGKKSLFDSFGISANMMTSHARGIAGIPKSIFEATVKARKAIGDDREKLIAFKKARLNSLYKSQEAVLEKAAKESHRLGPLADDIERGKITKEDAEKEVIDAFRNLRDESRQAAQSVGAAFDESTLHNLMLRENSILLKVARAHEDLYVDDDSDVAEETATTAEEPAHTTPDVGGFGDADTNLRELASLLGVTPPKENLVAKETEEKAKPVIKGEKKEIDTDIPKKERSVPADDEVSASGIKLTEEELADPKAALAKYREQAKEGLKAVLKENSGRLNAFIVPPVFDSRVIIPAVKMGRLYVHMGVTKLRDFAATMVNELGEEVRPWVESIYSLVKNYPKNLDFDENTMTVFVKTVGSVYLNNGIHDIKGMRELIHKYGMTEKEHDAMLDAAYKSFIVFLSRNKGIYGNEADVRTDAGSKFKVRYKVMPSDMVVPSQIPSDFSDNPAYDKGLQPRDRNRTALRSQVQKMEASLDPDLLADSRSLNEGAPIVNSRNMVENGNGRTIAICRVYADSRRAKQAEAYRKYLIDHAEKFGLTKEEVENVPNPILVRERSIDSDALLPEIIQSTTGGARMGAVEQARVDAEKIGVQTLDKYVYNDDGDLTTAANDTFVRAAIRDIATREDLNALTTADGAPSSDGIIRVKNALYAKAYNNPNLLSKIAESGNTESKRLAKASLAAAPEMAKIREGISNGTVRDDLDAPTAVSRAVDAYESAHERGNNANDVKDILEKELRQQQMLVGDDMPEAAKRLAIAFADTNKKPGATSFLLNRLADGVQQSDNPMEGSLIDTEKSPLEDYVQTAIDETYDKYGLGGTNERNNDGVSELAERNSERANQNAVGRNDEGGGTAGRNGQSVPSSQEGVRGRERVGDTGVHDGSADARGKGSDTGVQGRAPGTAVATEQNSAGDSDNPRSVIVGRSGNPAENIDRGAEEAASEPTKERPVDEAIAERVNSELDEFYGKDTAERKKFEKDLKVLQPMQKLDVMKTEKRFSDPANHGMLFTNGTGTGKTYTGLGAIKRYVEEGKDNILIVTPADQINLQWADSALHDFGIKVTPLKDTNDAGKGVSITTYANFRQNPAILDRKFDLIVFDESQNIMGNKDSDDTAALRQMRAVTRHKNGFDYYFETKNKDAYDELHKIAEEGSKLDNELKDAYLHHEEGKVDEIQKKRDKNTEEYNKIFQPLNKERLKEKAEWEKMTEEERGNVVFLSATPFQYVKNVMYADGYLFNVDTSEKQGEEAVEDFFINNFGYRKRYGKLTKPDGDVDTSLLEQDFHDKLEKEGALSGRQASFDKDYDRGFVLTPNAVGDKIDKGIDALRATNANGLLKYPVYSYVLSKTTLKKTQLNYLLEYIKAKESLPLIDQYLKSGKKVVVFHQSIKEHDVSNPFEMDDEFMRQVTRNPQELAELKREYEEFQALHPELFGANLGLDALKSPIETLKERYGARLAVYNGNPKEKRAARDKDGKVIKKPDGTNLTIREAGVEAFNDDNSGVDVIVVQQDAGGAGINLHDTTGKHQRVLLQLSVPLRPSYAIQIEGRIYRIGMKTNAIIRYLTTGTHMENRLFTDSVAGRASTVENLALGRAGARALRDSFVNLYEEIYSDAWERRLPGSEGEGTGGKAMDMSNTGETLSDFDAAINYYNALQKRNARNKSAEGRDYYPTPEPLGLKMVEWSGARDGDDVLEPSAGHGAISRWFPANAKKTIVEASPVLMNSAKLHTFGAKAVEGRFEDFSIQNKFDEIVMNPPYGVGGAVAMPHVAKAYKHLRNGGRLVAVVPEGPAMEKRFDKWFNGDEKATDPDAKKGVFAKGAFLTAEIHLPDVTFSKAGTKVKTKIIVIDKAEKITEEGRDELLSRHTEIDLRDVTSTKDLFNRIRDLSLPPKLDVAEYQDPDMVFDVGEIDNDQMALAKRNGYLNFAEASAVADIASDLGGGWSSYDNGYLFYKNDAIEENTKARDEFVREANRKIHEMRRGQKKLSTTTDENGIPLTVDEIRERAESAFGGNAEVTRDGDVVFHPAENVTVRFTRGTITMTEGEAAAANEAHQGALDEGALIAGSAEVRQIGADYEAVITLTPEGRGRDVDHEIMHIAMAFLNPKERAALHTYARKVGGNGLTADQREEIICDDYGKWRDARIEQRRHVVGKIFQKIQDFAYKTIPFLGNTRGRIYRDLESGRIFDRSPDADYLNKMSERITAKYSVTDSLKKFMEKSRADLEANENVHIRKEKKESAPKYNYETIKLSTFGSPSRSENSTAKALYSRASRVGETQRHYRRKWLEQESSILDELTNEEDADSYASILWYGDMIQKNFSDKELEEAGVNEAVRNAYHKTRGLLSEIRNALDIIRSRAHVETLRVDEERLAEIRKVPFFKIQNVTDNNDGTYTVSIFSPEFKVRDIHGMTQERLEKLKKSKNVYVALVKKTPSGKLHVRYYSRATGVANIAGYVPHLFHDIFITERKLNVDESAKEHVVDVTKDGLEKLRNNESVHIVSEEKNPNKKGHFKVTYTEDVYDWRIVGSADTMKEAVEIANEMPKDEGQEYFLNPKSFVGGLESAGIMMGDKDYDSMLLRETSKLKISLPEAKELMQGIARKSNKHKFFGSFLHRKGAEGYEKDVAWVLKNHIEASARYVAVEPFKYWALNRFERQYGRFDSSYEYFSEAGWAKRYIEATLGKPPELEILVNTLLEKIPGFRRIFSSKHGGRGSRALAAYITTGTGVMKLGVFSISSAMLNLTQLINLNAEIGPKAMLAGIRHALHPTEADRMVLKASGVEDDLNISTIDGVSNLTMGTHLTTGKKFMGMRSNFDNPLLRMMDYTAQVLGKSMILFSATEQFLRRATILGAYWKYRATDTPISKFESLGMTDGTGMRRAKEVNNRVNLDYTRADDPEFFRQIRGTVIGDMGIQFKKYAVKQLGNIAHYFPVFGEAEAMQKVRFWVPQLLITGLFTPFPAQDLIMQLIGLFIDDDDPEASMKKAIMEWAGNDPAKKKLALTAMYGLFGTTGIDVSSRVGLSNVLPEYDGPASVFGAAGSTVVGTLSALQEGDNLKALKMSVPSLANFYQAWTGQAVDAKGRVTQEFDGFQRLFKLAGFRTTEESLSYDLNKITANERAKARKEKDEARKDFREDPSRENRNRLKELGYSSKQIRELQKEAKETAANRTAGGMTKKESREMRGVLDFVVGDADKHTT